MCPSKRTRPAVGSYTPVIALNTVVLPAPFGPINPKISPGWIAIDTSSTAVSPPKRIESDSSARIGSELDIEHCSGAFGFHLSRLHLRGAPAVGQQALGSEDHHRDERYT